MEDKTRALIVTGAVLLLILALIIAAIFYLIRFIQGRQAGITATNTQNSINFSPSPEADGVISNGSAPVNQGDFKTYNGTGFQLSYAKNWGILTCSNSQNVEFDPTNGTDQLKVACDYAQKPITVIVGAQCEGQTTQIGTMQVVKSQKQLSQGTEKAWCVKTGGSNLLFTNRVSGNEVRGYGKEDQTSAIEQMISRIKVGNAS